MPTQSTKTTITASEHLQVIGLVTLAEQANAEINRLRRAVASIVGEEVDQYGWTDHSDDAVNEAGAGRPVVALVGQLLENLGIKVAPESPEDTNA